MIIDAKCESVTLGRLCKQRDSQELRFESINIKNRKALKEIDLTNNSIKEHTNRRDRYVEHAEKLDTPYFSMKKVGELEDLPNKKHK